MYQATATAASVAESIQEQFQANASTCMYLVLYFIRYVM